MHVRFVSNDGVVPTTLEDGTQLFGSPAQEDERPRLSEALLRAMQGPRFVSVGLGVGAGVGETDD